MERLLVHAHSVSVPPITSITQRERKNDTMFMEKIVLAKS